MLEWIGLVAAGLAIRTYAGAVGAGGGFLLAPLLLLRHPGAQPEEITTATLAMVVIANGASTLYAGRRRRMDRPLAGLLAAAAIPAALLGAAATTLLPRDAFSLAVALLLLATGLYLVLRPVARIAAPFPGGWRREVRDRSGARFTYRVPVWRSLAATAAAAGGSTLVGLGGGLLYLPLAARVMHVPHAVSVTLAQALITVTAAAGVALHLLAGNAGPPLEDTPAVAVGLVASLPLARRVQDRLGEGALTRALAAGLFAVGLRTALLAF